MRRAPRTSTLSDEEFSAAFVKHGAHKLSKITKQNVRTIFKRRENIEIRTGVQLRPPDQARSTRLAESHAPVLKYEVKNGVVLIGSDAHIWPGPQTTAMRAFVKFCKELRPSLAIMNGDVLDFPQISRHPPIGHNKLPDLSDEIEAAKDQLYQIEMATPRSCKLVWTLGNHCARFETRLATVAPEYAKLHGHSLKDHYPAWNACWRVDINADITVKHRHKGGTHATHNSTLWAGRTMVTGHLHSQRITPLTDYLGTRYGIDTGCLADPSARAFVDYTEAGPLNWRSGFCVLTFKDGKLLPPELVTVWDHAKNAVTFRGDIITV